MWCSGSRKPVDPFSLITIILPKDHEMFLSTRTMCSFRLLTTPHSETPHTAITLGIDSRWLYFNWALN